MHCCLQEQKVYVDRRAIQINKPVHLKSGVNIALESWHRSFHLVCETAGNSSLLLTDFKFLVIKNHNHIATLFDDHKKPS